MRTIEHNRKILTHRLFGDEIANIVDGWEDNAPVRSDHEILSTVGRDETFDSDLRTSGVVEDECHVDADAGEDADLQGKCQASEEGTEAGNEVGF